MNGELALAIREFYNIKKIWKCPGVQLTRD